MLIHHGRVKCPFEWKVVFTVRQFSVVPLIQACLQYLMAEAVFKLKNLLCAAQTEQSPENRFIHALTYYSFSTANLTI